MKGNAEVKSDNKEQAKGGKGDDKGGKQTVNYDVLHNAVKGAVVTRFPPEPSGYLHIGHVKAVMLNYYYAKHYEGKMILRFDDTNTKKESVEYADSIMEDLKKLGIVADKITHTSDYFDFLMETMTKLIHQDKCYCDNIPQEEMQKNRMVGKSSKCRENSVEENLKIWDAMKVGDPSVREYCVRGKISVDDKNKCMRDPVFYRFSDIPHHRTGDKYKIYPTYDFCCPIVDSIEGVTHCLRTDEYNDRNAMYEWIIGVTGLRPVEIFEYSRLNMVNTILSKRNLKWFVETGKVSGWNDPRFPTVQGILRRGMQVDAMKEFMLLIGPSKNTNYMEWDKIWSMNKDVIDVFAKRFMGVSAENGVPFFIENFGDQDFVKVENDYHPKNPDLGKKDIFQTKDLLIDFDDAKDCKDGEKITLLKWGNVVVSKVDIVDGVVKAVHAKQDPDDKDFKKTRKIHWISANSNYNTPLVLVEYDHLITVKKMDDKTKIEDVVNPNSMFETKALGEAELKTLQKGDIIQLERRGYFVCDVPASDTAPVVLILIPDGKAKSMSNISTKVDAKATSGGAATDKPKEEKKDKKEKKEKNKEKKGGDAGATGSTGAATEAPKEK